MPRRVLTVTMEPTGMCNLGCAYCYAVPDAATSLTEDEYLEALRHIARHADDRGFDEAHCVWLGGEPLLAGIRFFERVASLTARLPARVRMRHFVQTNGLLLDSDYCRLFREANIHLGVSLDGPRDLHDAFRTTRRGEPTHARVLERLELLREHQVPFGCVAVVTRQALGREQEIYEFFQDLGCGFRINPLIPGHKAMPRAGQLEPEEYGRCLVRFFDAWSVAGPQGVNVSPLDNYVYAMARGEPRECQHQSSCATRSIGIKPNGEVTICGRFQGQAFGNLRQSPLPELLAVMASDPLRAREPSLRGCHACAYWSQCHGGCPHNAAAFGRAVTARDPFCAAYRMIFSHIQQALSA